MKRSKEGERREIVIVGGGYVGFHAYRKIMSRLGRRVHRGEIGITLIDPETAHTFHGWSGETIAGAISDQARRSPFRRIFRHARIIRGYAGTIDPLRKRIAVRSIDGRDAGSIPFDHLVLGVGVGDDTDRIPGTREFGVGLRRGDGPEGLRSHLVDRLEEAELEQSRDRRASLLSFVVVGGGFTGVETAAAILEYLDYLRPRYRSLQDREDSVTLVHAGESILEEIGSRRRLITRATDELVGRGLRLRLGLQAERIEIDRVVLSDGSAIASRTVIPTVGSRVREIPGGELWDRDRCGRVVTDEYLRVRSASGIWAGGDGAHVRRADTGRPTPPNALWAIKHGEWIGKNIAAELTGRRLHPFTYRGLGQAASLGVGSGLVELKGMQFTGRIGWIMRLAFFLWFVPCRRTGLRGLAEWVCLPFTGRTTSSTRPITPRSIAAIDGRRRSITPGGIPGGYN